MQQTEPLTPRRSRLQEADQRPRLFPWARAWDLKHCQLYWMPVHAYPAPFRQRQWLLEFQQRWQAAVRQSLHLSPEVFLQMKVISPDYRDVFLKTSREFYPIFSLGRHPARPLPPLPDQKYAEDLQKGKIKYDAHAVQPDYCYWFLRKRPQQQLEAFLGSGGTTMVFLQAAQPVAPMPKPKTANIRDSRVLAMVQATDFDAMAAEARSLEAPFLAKSKDLFAGDLRDDPQYPGLLYTLPLLAAADFFAAALEEVDKWFDLFPIYWRESPEDKGVLLAAAQNIEPMLEEVLLGMRQDGLEYPA